MSPEDKITEVVPRYGPLTWHGIGDPEEAASTRSRRVVTPNVADLATAL